MRLAIPPAATAVLVQRRSGVRSYRTGHKLVKSSSNRGPIVYLERGIAYCDDVASLAAWRRSLPDYGYVVDISATRYASISVCAMHLVADSVYWCNKRPLADFLHERTDEEKLRVVQTVPEAIAWFKPTDQSPALCKAAVAANPETIAVICAEARTEAICLQAVSANGHVVQFLNSDERTEAVCLAAVTQNGRAIGHLVGPAQRTREVCRAALRHCGVMELVTYQELCDSM